MIFTEGIIYLIVLFAYKLCNGFHPHYQLVIALEGYVARYYSTICNFELVSWCKGFYFSFVILFSFITIPNKYTEYPSESFDSFEPYCVRTRTKWLKMCENESFFRVLTHFGSNESNDSLGVFYVCIQNLLNNCMW